jgi:hypothetical protein
MESKVYSSHAHLTSKATELILEACEHEVSECGMYAKRAVI